jgi:hypothetical protein
MPHNANGWPFFPITTYREKHVRDKSSAILNWRIPLGRFDQIFISAGSSGSIKSCRHNHFQILRALCYRSQSHRLTHRQHEPLTLKCNHLTVSTPSEARFANHVNTLRKDIDLNTPRTNDHSSIRVRRHVFKHGKPKTGFSQDFNC